MFTEEGRYNYAQCINMRNSTYISTNVKNLNDTTKIFFLVCYKHTPQYRSQIYDKKLSEY